MADYYAAIDVHGVSRFNMIELLSEGQIVRIDSPDHALHGRKGHICRVTGWVERLPVGNEMRLCVDYSVRVRVSSWWNLKPKYEVVTLRRGHLDVLDLFIGGWRD